MSDLNEKTIQEIVKLARTGAAPQTVGNTEFVVIPADMKVIGLQDYRHNKYAEAPHRKTGTVKVFDAESFCHYWTLFSDANSRTFADETTSRVLGVLDYHAALDGGPRWGEHRLELSLRASTEWQTWKGQDGKRLAQIDFAEFIENNAADIVRPSAGTMMDVAKTLSAKTDVEFASAIRLSDGSVKFKYTEQIAAKFGSGDVDVPEEFVISIPVYIGRAAVDITARLRYRIASGKLTFWYDLLRADAMQRQAFSATRQAIEDTLKITIINGTP